jgi:hypothetical protein
VRKHAGFGTWQVQILALLSIVFFTTVRFAISKRNKRIVEVPMGDNNKIEGLIEWTAQLFEFVWNGASGVAVTGAALVDTPA